MRILTLENKSFELNDMPEQIEDEIRFLHRHIPTAHHRGSYNAMVRSCPGVMDCIVNDG